MFPPEMISIFGYLVGGNLTIFLALYVVFGYGWIPKYLHRSFEDADIDSR
jgi:hypothetical protein